MSSNLSIKARSLEKSAVTVEVVGVKRSGESRVVKALGTGGFAASKAIPAGLAAA
jgi:hypothetical protein